MSAQGLTAYFFLHNVCLVVSHLTFILEQIKNNVRMYFKDSLSLFIKMYIYVRGFVTCRFMMNMLNTNILVFQKDPITALLGE